MLRLTFQHPSILLVLACPFAFICASLMEERSLLISEVDFGQYVAELTMSNESDAHMADIHSDIKISGLHAVVDTTILVNVPIRLTDCRVSAILSLPATTYMDLNEIRSTRDFGSPVVLSYEDIDVEQPSFQSTNHKVIIEFDAPSLNKFDSFSSSWEFKATYPIHFRYQKPIGHEDVVPYRQAVLEPVQSFMKCTGSVWRPLKPKSPVDNHIVDVSVGKLSDLKFVSFGTFTATICVFVYILIAVVSLAKRSLMAASANKVN
eukprot:CFRG8555T1